MKILLLNDFGSPIYGAELQVLALRDGLRRLGHEVLLLSSRAQPVADVAILADVTCFGSTSRLQALSRTANPSAYLTLRRVLETFRPDVVHVRMFLWQLSPLILPLLRAVPSLYQAVIYKSVCPVGSKLLPDGSACTERYGRACLRHGCVTLPTWAASMAQLALFERWRDAFDGVIVPSTSMRDILQANGIDVAHVVPNGVEERPARPPLSDPPLVAYAGRLSPEKGVDILLRAFAIARVAVPTARLVIAGDGPLAGVLRRLAESLGIDGAVEWLGHVSRDVVEHRFAAAWVQAVPSLWQEPFGNVTAEAMARGTAVVASRVGGAIDLLEDGVTGLFVLQGDPDALAGALIRTLSDRGEAERLGVAGRRAAHEKLSRDRAVETMLGIYDEMMISFSRKGR